MNEKLTKIKRLIGRLEWKEFTELESYMRKKREKMWEEERLRRKKEHEKSIESLPGGTMVTCTDSRYQLCGKIGKVVRHLERNSNRTVVDFGKTGIWRVPRSKLSTRIDENEINNLKMCKNLSAIVNKALNKI